MKLEDQVCSLELAKRLKELGVKLESLFYWHYWDNRNTWTLEPAGRYKDEEPFFFAFTVAELGAMLPARVSRNIADQSERGQGTLI